MPYPNIAMPTYAALEPRAVAWAAARELVTPEGQPLKATKAGQHGKTLEEIGEAKDALYLLGCIVGDGREALARDAALEFGDILVTLCLQAAMHSRTLERCKAEAGRLNEMPLTWEYVDRWAAMLGESVSNPRSTFRFDAPSEIGAIAFCVEDVARIELSLMGPECLALALAKIEGRSGSVVDGVFVKA